MEDPMEKLIADALTFAGIPFTREGQKGAVHTLDFHLPESDVYVEVKQFHSDRISDQMARAPNVIAAQGRPAVEFLARLIRDRFIYEREMVANTDAIIALRDAPPRATEGLDRD